MKLGKRYGLWDLQRYGLYLQTKSLDAKVMGYYRNRLWVVREMGYERVDCSPAKLAQIKKK